MEIYRFVDYMGQKAFLFCFKDWQAYEVIKDFGTYIVGNHWTSSEEPIEFIHSQCRAINAETRTGIQEIKRVLYRNLPKLVKQYIKENIEYDS